MPMDTVEPQVASFHSIGRSEGQKTRFNSIDSAIVQRAVADLREHTHTAEFKTACEFFFLGPALDDLSEPRTFESLCQRNGIHSETAARAIWDGLPVEIQNRIKSYLVQSCKTTNLRPLPIPETISPANYASAQSRTPEPLMST